jgi:uncharacterized membrane protein YdjX (TVP38/TMEM64 family)
VKTSHKKRIIFLIIILALIAITRLADLDRYLTFENLQENKFRLQQIVQGNYVLSVGGYIVTYIVVVAFSIPGAAILTLTGGFLFGVLWGAIYVNAGATTGAALAFLFCRYVAGEWVQNKYQDKLKTFNKALSKNGYRYLLALRFIPVFPFFLINIFAGLTKIPLRTFIWTTSIGIFPGSLVYAFAGKQLGDIQSVEDIFSARIAVAFSLLALLVLFPVIVNYFRGKKQTTTRETGETK